jgi:glycosyltransferase involved in cell wall biosynthesis
VLILPWWIALWAVHDLLLMWSARRGGRTRVLLLCHNVAEHEGGPARAWLAGRVLRRADAFIVHARSEKERLRRIVGAEPPILSAFLPTSFPREVVERSHLPPELTPPTPDRSVILFFGFVRPYKGLDVLISALPRVLAERPVILWVVGEFWGGRARHEARLRKLGLEDRVRIVDRYVSNEQAAGCFRHASAVVQPYRSATGSGVAPIALDLGVPLVASAVGSLPDVIEDGVNGKLVPPGDPEALAAAVLEVLEPQANARLRDGARKTGDRWTWDRLAGLVHGFVREEVLHRD